MAIKINFDTVNNPETPTLILAYRDGKKIGKIVADGVVVRDSMTNPSEISFRVAKYLNGEKNFLWNDITDFKLVWYKEADLWFEAYVEVDESNETIKSVICTQLGQAELSQIMLYDIEINTENDIARDDYVIPTVLYNPEHPEASLLHRIMEKAEHYSIMHVDDTIANIQRTFTFDSISLHDALHEIEEEIGCLVDYHSHSYANGNVQRVISLYDLRSNCNACGYRGEFTNVCPECGSYNVNEGYGEDTTIFVASDELANEIQYTTDVEAIKNCFKLEAGDDLMTATVRNCNPNGSDYIWHISDDIKADMSAALVSKIESYEELYEAYQTNCSIDVDASILNQYNALVSKYQVYNEDLQKISSPINGCPALMEAIYNTIDLSLFLESGLMPDVSMSDTNATEQAALLTSENLSPVAVANANIVSLATANSAVLAMAKVIVDSRYRVKINSSGLSGKTWVGNFIITNYSDEEDTAVSATVSVSIDDDYESFIEQKLDKAMKDKDKDNLSITGLFKMDYDSFCNELKKYCLNSLTSFHDACQACLDILIEQGVGDKKTWASAENNLYDNLYTPYYQKLKAIESEMGIRQDEVYLIDGVYDTDGTMMQNGLYPHLNSIKEDIQSMLDFQKYLGKELWLEFCTYRREDKYSNDNYISDGLTNAELFKKALEFIKVAKNEIYKSAELQHSISSNLKNLLVIEKFRPLIKYFEVGNWIRVEIDGKLYKLRLIEYEVDFDNIDSLSVEFSDVLKISNGEDDQKSLISKTISITSSYDSVKKQANQGSQSNQTLQQWENNGWDISDTKIVNGGGGSYTGSYTGGYVGSGSGTSIQTQTWDSHGMLFRKYDTITGTYDDEQLKIINSTITITNDNWETVKTAVGAYYYFSPITNELTKAYGVNAEVLIGKLILGEQLGLYNDSGSLSFDNNGLLITNGINSFGVNPNAEALLYISKYGENVFWVDADGELHIKADGSDLDISDNPSITNVQSQITQNADKIELSVTSDQVESMISISTEGIMSEVEDKDKNLQSQITQNAEAIKLRVTAEETQALIDVSAEDIILKVENADENLQSQINVNAEAITSRVTNDEMHSAIDQKAGEIISTVETADGKLQSQIDQNAEAIKLRVTSDEVESMISVAKDEIKAEVTTPDGIVNNSVVINTEGISIKAGGTFTVDSGNFAIDENGNVTMNGSITAESGEIGGWIIGTGSLYSGSGSNHVSLSTADSTYAIWAGAESSGSAPFRVARDGTAYLTKLYVTDENGVAQSSPVNLNTNYWKMDKAYSRSVRSMSVNDNTLTITLYDGTSVNFKKAAAAGALIPSGGGTDTFTVSYIEGYTGVGTGTTIDSGIVRLRLNSNTYNSASRVIASFNGNDYSMISVGGVYTAGETAGKNSVTLSKSWSGGILTVKATNGKTSTAQLSKGTETWSGNICSFPVLDGGGSTGYTMKVDASDRYEAGENSVTVPNGNIVRQAADYYAGGDDYSTTVYIKATASNGAYGTQSFSVSGKTAFNAGYTDAVDSATLSIDGTDVVTTFSNGESKSIDAISIYEDGYADAVDSATLSIDGTDVIVTFGDSSTKSIDAISIYEDGEESGYNAGMLQYKPTSASVSGTISGDHEYTLSVSLSNTYGNNVATFSNISFDARDAYDNGYDTAVNGLTLSVDGTTVTGAFDDGSTKTLDVTSVYNTGWNECRDNCSSAEVYTISEYAPGTLYVKVGDYYSSAGSSWVKVSRKYGVYYLPSAKT